MDRTAPIRPSQRQTLIVGYRDERGVGKLADNIREPRQIEPSVHRRNEGHAEAAEQWQMQPIDVRVHDVEIFDPLRDRLELNGACGRGIGGGPAEAERAGPDRMKIPARAGISAGEQGHLVAQADELVDQPRDYPLCPAVKLGRNALGQGAIWAIRMTAGPDLCSLATM